VLPTARHQNLGEAFTYLSIITKKIYGSSDYDDPAEGNGDGDGAFEDTTI
jgi:hypothetical protein